MCLFTGEVQKFLGKYVLLTSLDESDEVNVWKFYNVIRTVKETFHVLKTDLDIRPVYHKSDGGIKAHLNLAIERRCKVWRIPSFLNTDLTDWTDENDNYPDCNCICY